jgi:membrane-bound serine protease (ClpP class)
MIAASPLLFSFDAQRPQWALPPWLAFSIIVLFALILILALRLARLSRQKKLITEVTGVVGLRGRAETNIEREGAAFVRGELWRARSDNPIATGEPVRVVGVDGLAIVVERDSNNSPLPPTGSASDEHQILPTQLQESESTGQ